VGVTAVPLNYVLYQISEKYEVLGRHLYNENENMATVRKKYTFNFKRHGKN
jgi:hypothetical protein